MYTRTLDGVTGTNTPTHYPSGESGSSWTICVCKGDRTARDRIGRFRAVNVSVDHQSMKKAEEALLVAIADVVKNDQVEDIGDQGDETNQPIDLLRLPTDFDPDEVHPYFRILLEEPSREPARAVIREIGPWPAPSDPHMVKEFQFDPGISLPPMSADSLVFIDAHHHLWDLDAVRYPWLMAYRPVSRVGPCRTTSRLTRKLRIFRPFSMKIRPAVFRRK